MSTRNKSLFVFFFLHLILISAGWAQEICDNGIDDDNNGLIDLNDPNCDCEVVDYRSMIPNPSFENFSCCPSQPGQMRCVNDWRQASAGTTDYMNLCGWWSQDFLPPPLPIPSGDACFRFLNGNWFLLDASEIFDRKEYAGVCLNYPMVKGEKYVFEFYLGFGPKETSPDINLSFFGTNDCINLPFTTGSDFGCPLRDSSFILLTSELIPNQVGDYWEKIRIEIIPEETVSAIVIGPDCEQTKGRIDFYYYLDNLILNREADLDFQLLDSGSPCASDFTFAVTDNGGFSYQWYKEGIAIVGETEAKLSAMYGEGRYQLKIMNNRGCRISEDYVFAIPFHIDTVYEVACVGDEFLFGNNRLTEPGVYVENFISAANCDSMVTLNLEFKEGTLDSLQMNVLKGADIELNGKSYDKEGIYPIRFTSENGCDSLVILELSVQDVFIPNVFSPNGDGRNDVFQVLLGDVDITDTTVSIYDRWGNRIFVGKEWDGTRKGKSLEAGVFIYVVELTTTTNERLRYTGDLTLIR